MTNRMWDIHCHILPGVDDGAKTLEESLALLKEEVAQGVTRIILTPHYRLDMFEPEMSQIKAACLELHKALKNLAVTEPWAANIRLFLGCEFHANMDMVETLNAGGRPTLGGSRYVLVEFSSMDEFGYIKERCRALMQNGYVPIIAHAERYRCLRTRNYDKLEELVNSGVLIQMNAVSILGKDGFSTGRWCGKAIEHDLVHFIASDAHNLSDRPPYMKECYEHVKKKFGEEIAEDLFGRNAIRIFKK